MFIVVGGARRRSIPAGRDSKPKAQAGSLTPPPPRMSLQLFSSLLSPWTPRIQTGWQESRNHAEKLFGQLVFKIILHHRQFVYVYFQNWNTHFESSEAGGAHPGPSG